MPYIVQFPHPGKEHKPSPAAVGTEMDWNVGDHRRKFLTTRASWVRDDGVHEGDIGFWGEWEAPSRVECVWPKDGALPRFLHRPLYRPPTTPKFQNTDPMVFGERFLYTNCKQLHNSVLRQLTPGSLLLFGSGTGAGFILDTVLVVGDRERRPYELGETGVLGGHPVADAVVFEPLRTTRHVGRTCVAYQGRMHADGPDRPYSFVPCRPLGADVRFARPLLEPEGALSEFIHPKLFMGVRVREVAEAAVAQAWRQLVDLCRAAGLVQGVRLEPPEVPAAGRPLPATADGSC